MAKFDFLTPLGYGGWNHSNKRENKCKCRCTFTKGSDCEKQYQIKKLVPLCTQICKNDRKSNEIECIICHRNRVPCPHSGTLDSSSKVDHRRSSSYNPVQAWPSYSFNVFSNKLNHVHQNTTLNLPSAKSTSAFRSKMSESSSLPDRRTSFSDSQRGPNLQQSKNLFPTLPSNSSCPKLPEHLGLQSNSSWWLAFQFQIFFLLQTLMRLLCFPSSTKFILSTLILSSSFVIPASGSSPSSFAPNKYSSESYGFWDRSLVLDDMGSFVVEWAATNTDIQFRLSARTRGYIGFGLSSQATMHKADIVVG